MAAGGIFFSDNSIRVTLPVDHVEMNYLQQFALAWDNEKKFPELIIEGTDKDEVLGKIAAICHPAAKVTLNGLAPKVDFRDLKPLFPRLSELTLRKIAQVDRWESLGSCAELSKIHINVTGWTTVDLQFLARAGAKVTELILDDVRQVYNWDSLAACKELSKLVVNGVRTQADLSFLKNAGEKLTDIELRRIRRIWHWSALGACQQLERLSINEIRCPVDCRFLGRLTANLHSLSFCDLREIANLQAADACAGLTRFHLSGADPAVDLNLLGENAKRITSLTLGGSGNDSGLASAASCRRFLRLRKLMRLGGRAMSAAEHHDANPHSTTVRRMRRLGQIRPSRLINLEKLSSCTALEKLEIRGVETEIKLDFLERIGKNMREVVLWSVPRVSGWEGLRRCRKIIRLEITGVKSPIDLQFLERLADLEELVLFGVGKVENWETLGGCEKLKRLFLGECALPENLAALLEKLTALQQITLPPNALPEAALAALKGHGTEVIFWDK